MRESIEVPGGMECEEELARTFFEANKPRNSLEFTAAWIDQNMNFRVTYLDRKTGWSGELTAPLFSIIAWVWKNHG